MHTTRVLFLLAAIVLAGPDRVGGTEPGRHDASSKARRAPTPPEVRRFRELWTARVAAGGDEAATKRRAHDYLVHLPAARRVPVGRVLLHDPDPAVSYMGANLLIRAGHEQESIPTLATLFVEHPEVGVGYDWVHGEDPTRTARVTLAMSRYLLANLDRYSGDQRRRVEQILMGGEPGDQPFSREKVEARLREAEQQLRSSRPGS
jgi:hypothetical protein